MLIVNVRYFYTSSSFHSFSSPIKSSIAALNFLIYLLFSLYRRRAMSELYFISLFASFVLSQILFYSVPLPFAHYIAVMCSWVRFFVFVIQ